MNQKTDNIMYDLLKEVRAKQDDQDEVLQEQSKILVDLKKNVEINTKDLTEHKEGVIGNRARVAVTEKILEQVDIVKLREDVDDIKAPLTVKSLVSKVLIATGGISTVGGAIYLIIKIVEFLGKN